MQKNKTKKNRKKKQKMAKFGEYCNMVSSEFKLWLG